MGLLDHGGPPHRRMSGFGGYFLFLIVCFCSCVFWDVEWFADEFYLYIFCYVKGKPASCNHKYHCGCSSSQFYCTYYIWRRWWMLETNSSGIFWHIIMLHTQLLLAEKNVIIWIKFCRVEICVVLWCRIQIFIVDVFTQICGLFHPDYEII